jgi:hypothetical protein
MAQLALSEIQVQMESMEQTAQLVPLDLLEQLAQALQVPQD